MNENIYELNLSSNFFFFSNMESDDNKTDHLTFCIHQFNIIKNKWMEIDGNLKYLFFILVLKMCVFDHNFFFINRYALCMPEFCAFIYINQVNVCIVPIFGRLALYCLKKKYATLNSMSILISWLYMSMVLEFD